MFLHVAPAIEIMLRDDVLCLRCGRKLKNSKYIDVGYGLACYKKILEQEDENQVKIEEVIDIGKIEGAGTGR